MTPATATVRKLSCRASLFATRACLAFATRAISHRLFFFHLFSRSPPLRCLLLASSKVQRLGLPVGKFKRLHLGLANTGPLCTAAAGTKLPEQSWPSRSRGEWTTGCAFPPTPAAGSAGPFCCATRADKKSLPIARSRAPRQGLAALAQEELSINPALHGPRSTVGTAKQNAEPLRAVENGKRRAVSRERRVKLEFLLKREFAHCLPQYREWRVCGGKFLWTGCISGSWTQDLRSGRTTRDRDVTVAVFACLASFSSVLFLLTSTRFAAFGI